MKTRVLVTGGSGQLGQSIQSIALQQSSLEFLFCDKNMLDITNSEHVLSFFKTNKIDWCINCAAYTNVDKAEVNQDQAYQINVLGAKNIAKACQVYNVKLIHISTDFVFDGQSNKPYTETDITNPINTYGRTKLQGEAEIASIFDNFFIIRTSWLYSEFGHNFMKTMLRLSSEKELIRVVDDQIGTPTYAGDIAEALIKLILDDTSNYGIFHFANHGEVSWFEFAKAIFEQTHSSVILEPIFSRDYITLAKRPAYSVLDTSKASEEMDIAIPFWKDSLSKAIQNFEDS
ncbi:dTDP-4-dehydrorhamnose reductase [Gelidibacter maritimus]|uniref:dTDP-4-dehydrorhamnose reductase n=1 Tax=Gelidibacter maritimus TaxID=2761487 RepID=A0A7W2M3B9_9FLAO|nr:dTDP-4-dehydrorhamnose reductase [Gelidibacter maritimus]MBA6151939.1 dTDP-4-dehydrorhamnose reductase [Gelidibacter maritimus]